MYFDLFTVAVGLAIFLLLLSNLLFKSPRKNLGPERALVNQTVSEIQASDSKVCRHNGDTLNNTDINQGNDSQLKLNDFGQVIFVKKKLRLSDMTSNERRRLSVGRRIR